MNTKLDYGDPIRIEACDLVRFDGKAQRITVVDGLAWITAEGKDIIANAGEKLILDGSREPILISALRDRALMVRVSRKGSIESKRVPTAAYRITPRARRS